MGDSPQRQPDSGQLVARQERLERLISQRLFYPVFQPIASLETGEVIAFEALTRPRPETGYQGPLEIFDDAAATGRLWELEDAVRESILSVASSMPDGMRVFCNNSPTVAADERFANRLAEQLRRERELTPARMVLEITERSEGCSIEALVLQSRRAKQLGFQIAVDDVGAGTSGLNRLMQLRPHWIKLDRELIDGVDRDQLKLNLVRFIVNFANLSGVCLLAEGVERKEELGVLIDLGVRYAQGYLLGRPSTSYQLLAPELADWIRKRWRSRRPGSGPDQGRSVLGSMCQRAWIVQNAMPKGEVAATIAKGDETGVVVVDGRRFVGWCPRELLLNVSPADAEPIGFITQSSGSMLSVTDSIGDALAHLSIRSESDLADPLVVSDGDAIIGVIPVRVLLSAAASGVASRRATMPVTGLPGRVAADLMLADLVRRRRAGERGSECAEAAVVDIVRLSTFNENFGYEAGDDILRQLSRLLEETTLDAAGDGGFVAHLSDDRFLVVREQGGLRDRLERLIERFEPLCQDPFRIGSPIQEEFVSSHSVERMMYPESQHAHDPGLRVLLLPNVLDRITDNRDLYRLEASLRQRADRELRSSPISRSIIVEDQRSQIRAA